MRHREHSRVDNVLLRAREQAYGVRYNREQGPALEVFRHPLNRRGLSHFPIHLQCPRKQLKRLARQRGNYQIERPPERNAQAGKVWSNVEG